MEFKKPTKHSGPHPHPATPPSGSSIPTGSRPTRSVPPRPPIQPIKVHDSTIARPTPPPVSAKKEAPAPSSFDEPTRSKHPRRKITFPNIVIVAACLLVATAVVHEATTQKGSASGSSQSPSYQTVLPKNTTADQLGGWKRVSPPEKDPVFAYSDTIDSVAISVSQQPLPASFQGDSENQVAELAKKFNATTKIKAASITIYLGTSSKGPQSAILVKNNLLILIKSQKKIGDTSWARYADSLN